MINGKRIAIVMPATTKVQENPMEGWSARTLVSGEVFITEPAVAAR
jgi:hypothetical protein